MRSAALVPAMLTMVLFLSCAGSRQLPERPARGPALIPRPAQMRLTEGHFRLDAATTLMIQPLDSLREVADYLAGLIRQGSGWQLAQGAGAYAESSAIVLQLVDSSAALGREGYRLEIQPQEILIQAAAPAGIFYGIQTLRQLWPVEWQRPAPPPQTDPVLIPCMSITDQPRYTWRGGMLDVVRHYFPKEFIYRYIDYLAMNKLNTFHWHLTDDQGWRIEIKRYPNLARVGAWRVDRESEPWNKRKLQQPGETPSYGGLYTQAEIRDIVAYARSRFITIVPEFEMPAHAGAALAAYPRYSCSGGPFTVSPGGVWPIVNLFCAGNDSTFTFLQNILDEIIDLFPGTYIHLGGDEADKSEWKKCPKCQARIRSEQLADETALQGYFMRRMEAYLASRGRRMIGWDEILEGGVPARATVMSWRGMSGGIAAARTYHDVVMAPTDYCYFDYYQGAPEYEPLAIGGYVPLERVYAFEPTPDSLSAVQATHILGCQANLWTEFIATPEHAEYMLFPRLLALAEVAWSPASARDWEDFLGRVVATMPRLEAMGIHAAQTIFNIQAELQRAPDGRSVEIGLRSLAPNNEIRYTLDNRPPTAASPLYAGPIALDRSATVMAGLFRNGLLQGKVVTVPFLTHLACGKRVSYGRPWSAKYAAAGAATLVDGRKGTLHYSDGAWQGFEQNNLEVVIDLGRKMEIHRISSSYLEEINSWIFGPSRVTYAFSDKGEVYITLADLPGAATHDQPDPAVQTFSRDFEDIEARYIKVVAANLGLCPPGHAGVGEKAWLFADEIIVE